MSASALIWQPIHAAIDEKGKAGDRLFWIAAPFIKLEALKQLFTTAIPADGLTVVTRWLPNDLISGVSDLEVFRYLTERGARLYVNTRVHMKLYIFESNTAVSTSGNLTLRGLGYVGKPNIEVGNYVDLTAADWINLYGVVGESRLMTPELYTRFEDYVASNPLPPAPISPPPDLLGPSKIYTLASLPATETPAALMEFYFNRSAYHLNPETARRGFHDLAIFEIQESISSIKDFNELLGKAFRKNPFVSDFISYLRSNNSLRFGSVNAWIQQKCEDVPLPYRWEIKENTRIFYNWLEHFFPEITWGRPNYSQVIYWRN